jgi:hypothetical protein
VPTVITEQLARQAVGLGQSDARMAAVLTVAIEAVSQLLDDICGPIVNRTITEVIDVPHRWPTIRVAAAPVQSFTTVTLYESGAPTVLTAETLTVAGDFLAELQQRVRPDKTTQLLSGVLRRRAGFGDAHWPAGVRVHAVYVAGRYASAALAGPTNFGKAAVLTLKSSWRAFEQSAVQVSPGEFVLPAGYFPSFALPDAAAELIARDRVHVVGMA